jgi:hypothetical protein
LSTDEDEPPTGVNASLSSLLQDGNGIDTSCPWLKEFNRYLDSAEEELSEGMTIAQWWGISNLCANK